MLVFAEDELLMGILVGKPAAAFELPDHTGQIHRLEQYAGAWLLLVFHRHLM